MRPRIFLERGNPLNQRIHWSAGEGARIGPPRIMRRFVSLALVVLLFPGCALVEHRFAQNKKKRGKTDAPAPFLIGSIALVSEDGSYVLIDNDSHPSPPLGTVVKSRTAGAESAELKVTDIRKRPFVVADIVKGTPQKGDYVFQ